jgi:hypothetical protein
VRLARLSGFTFCVPPLRDRIDDLGVLVSTILTRVAGERPPLSRWPASSFYAMLGHRWPFNGRELEQRLGTAVVLAESGRIQLSHAWTDGSRSAGANERPAQKGAPTSAQDEELRRQLAANLAEHEGNVTRVSEALGKRRTWGGYARLARSEGNSLDRGSHAPQDRCLRPLPPFSCLWTRYTLQPPLRLFEGLSDPLAPHLTTDLHNLIESAWFLLSCAPFLLSDHPHDGCRPPENSLKLGCISSMGQARTGRRLRRD